MSHKTRLQAFRKQKGLTQKELALKTGINKRTIVSYENKERNLQNSSIATLEKLANALDIPFYELFENEITRNAVKQNIKFSKFVEGCEND